MIVRRGMSELLAITIGIAITIAIGVMLYSFVPNLVNMSAQQQKISVTVMSSNAIDENSCMVSMSIRNLGTKPIEELSLTIVNSDMNITNILIPPDIAKLTPSTNTILIPLGTNPLAPGQEISIVFRVEGMPLISGSKINIVVTAKYIDGSTTSVTTTTMVI
uniref:Flagellin n=1 Tax=Ignisphaera aggregans TaxID=334771 RepID=A0A7C2VDI0_9CREN